MSELQCNCGRWVGVGEDARKVRCSYCVLMECGIPEDRKIKQPSGKPAGWHFMNEFVDKDGSVFHKGKEIPELKGTLKPTKTAPRKKPITKDEKMFQEAEKYKKKMKIKKAIQKQKDFVSGKVAK